MHGITQSQFVQECTGGKPKPSPKTMRRALVSALRSGQFRQTYGALCTVDEYRHRKYCCLGVACKVAQLAGFEVTEELVNGQIVFRYQNSADQNTLPSDLLGVYGFDNSSGQYGSTSLIVLNDDDDKSFKEIADVIESEPEGLFTN